MKHKKLAQEGGLSVYAVVFDPGDEALAGLKNFASDERISSASLTGIGGCSKAVLGYFSWEGQQYDRIPVDEQIEILSLVGDIATENGQPAIHAHMVVGLRDGTTRGGHLLEAHVRPTLEVIVTETPPYLRKIKKPGMSIATIDLG